MQSVATEYQRMSEELRAELKLCVERGDELFKPSSSVSREAVSFVRPRSKSLIFIRLISGAVAGREGDGKLGGIGLSEELVEHIKASSN